MLPDPILEKLFWAAGILATVAVMATHGHAAQSSPSASAQHPPSISSLLTGRHV